MSASHGRIVGMSRSLLGAWSAGLLAVALLLGGCSLPGSGPDAGDAADTLAAGLTKGSLTKVAFTGDDAAARSSYATITKGVDGAEVKAGHVSTKDADATATLDWRWKVGSKSWSYKTQVRMHKTDTSDGASWLVRWSPTVVEPSLKSGERLGTTTLKAQRGDILGAKGSTLVTQRPVLRVGLDKEKVAAGQVPDSARRLAQLVGVDAAAFAKQVAGTGPRAFVQALVYRRTEVPPRVLAGLSAIPGARAISDKLPLAPSKDFASAILGTVGPATAEIVKASKGRIHAGDDVGLSGLQKRYDEQLAGTRGEEVVATDAQGGARRILFTADPVAGKPLSTTIDPTLQTLAQKVLADVGPASALVAVRPSTGDLVAVASGPGSKGYNTATYGRYAPGSTFKIVSALALLRAGESPATTVPCTPTTVVDGKQFKNYSDYPSSQLGRITLETALANSCNTAFVSQHTKLGATALASAAAALGFGVDHDTGFPTFFGDVGTPGSETQAAASMIGQGTVLASPMAMATVVASVLKGASVLPRLLPAVKTDLKTPDKPLTAAEARQLRTMMRAVVERGSGVRLAGLPGQVIAKTGTAEFGDKPPLPTHAWMVAGRGDLAVAVFVERGESGSGTAGPILQSFLEKAR
jgi:cell division protein FtsI/penicillin-binding protein 2